MELNIKGRIETIQTYVSKMFQSQSRGNKLSVVVSIQSFHFFVTVIVSTAAFYLCSKHLPITRSHQLDGMSFAIKIETCEM